MKPPIGEEAVPGEFDLYKTPVAYHDRNSEVLCVHNFTMHVSQANHKEHSIRKLSLNLNIIDQPASEQTQQFYKVPDCYILIYCPSPDGLTIPKEDSEAILEWIRHKHLKMKDWFIIFSFEYATVNDFVPRQL